MGIAPTKQGELKMEFGHHPDPAVDFCLEVEAIEGELFDRKAGLPSTMDMGARITRAMQFKVGGDASAVVAKADLRKYDAAFNAGASRLPDQGRKE
jgi:hypothetical protein